MNRLTLNDKINRLFPGAIPHEMLPTPRSSPMPLPKLSEMNRNNEILHSEDRNDPVAGASRGCDGAPQRKISHPSCNTRKEEEYQRKVLKRLIGVDKLPQIYLSVIISFLRWPQLPNTHNYF